MEEKCPGMESGVFFSKADPSLRDAQLPLTGGVFSPPAVPDMSAPLESHD